MRLILTCLLLMALPPGAAVHGGEPGEERIGLEDLRAFTDAWGYIRDYYVEPVDDRQLLEAALRGMLSDLDPHSKWLSPEAFRDLEDQAVGRYGGLGLRVGSFGNHLRIVSVFDSGPAAGAGLESGDRIVAIDDTELDEDNIGDAPGMLRGPAGSDVRITVHREGEREPLEFALTRELIQRDSVTAERLGERYLHLGIQRFQQSTASELDRILDDLETPGSRPAGLILDLRNNPGGMLQVAIAVGDRFLSNQLVVTAEGRRHEEPREYRTGPGDRLADLPMVVLVDRGTASGAEILAAALRDHGRALIVGETTYGKGSVQTIWPLRNGSGIRLTTALYFTPSGDRIQARGITPDVLSTGSHRSGDQADMRRREADLRGHFPGESVETDTTVELAATDPMLADALRLLISMERLRAN